MSHKVQVAMYALGLSQWLQTNGFTESFAVSKEIGVWPVDSEMFELVGEEEMKHAHVQLHALLGNALDRGKGESPVPGLLHNLIDKPGLAKWKLNSKCMTCKYQKVCRDEASRRNHFSQLASIEEPVIRSLESSNGHLPDIADLDKRMSSHEAMCEERWKTCFNRFDDMDSSIRTFFGC